MPLAIRWAASTAVKFRNLFQELGLTEVIEKPTRIYVDNNVAVHWLKTGKITTGNQYYNNYILIYLNIINRGSEK